MYVDNSAADRGPDYVESPAIPASPDRAAVKIWSRVERSLPLVTRCWPSLKQTDFGTVQTGAFDRSHRSNDKGDGAVAWLCSLLTIAEMMGF
jgi:hypothetical protein